MSPDSHPEVWRQGDLSLPLSYEFDPGSETDGVTVEVPLLVLNRLDPGGFDWEVPGLRRELVTELIRSLPKQLRRSFVPAPDYELAADPRRDRDLMGRVQRLEQAHAELVRYGSGGRREDVERVRWMLEELRVSYFAQALGTAHPVSEKRILTELERLQAHRV